MQPNRADHISPGSARSPRHKHTYRRTHTHVTQPHSTHTALARAPSSMWPYIGIIDAVAACMRTHILYAHDHHTRLLLRCCVCVCVCGSPPNPRALIIKTVLLTHAESIILHKTDNRTACIVHARETHARTPEHWWRVPLDRCNDDDDVTSMHQHTPISGFALAHAHTHAHLLILILHPSINARFTYTRC